MKILKVFKTPYWCGGDLPWPLHKQLSGWHSPKFSWTEGGGVGWAVGQVFCNMSWLLTEWTNVQDWFQPVDSGFIAVKHNTIFRFKHSSQIWASILKIFCLLLLLSTSKSRGECHDKYLKRKSYLFIFWSVASLYIFHSQISTVLCNISRNHYRVLNSNLLKDVRLLI